MLAVFFGEDLPQRARVGSLWIKRAGVYELAHDGWREAKWPQ